MKQLALSLIHSGRKPSMKMYDIALPHRAITGCQNSSVLSCTLLSVIVLLAVVTLSGCSSTLELTSRWTNHELKVDGTGTEWNDATTLIPGPQVFVGIKNDRENLYVCLKTSDRITQVQMLALGTTVWIDTEGKKNKTFGIQFPVSGLLQGRRFPSQQNPQELQLFNSQFPSIIITEHTYEITHTPLPHSHCDGPCRRLAAGYLCSTTGKGDDATETAR